MRNLKIILSITRTHLLSRIKQTSVAALGVMFGISAYIIMMGFMTGLNGLLDGLVLNRTPHIHIFNEIEPSDSQPIDQSEIFGNDFNVVRSIKPKVSLEKIHDALPLVANLKKDSRVKGVTAQTTAMAFYVAGSIQLNGSVVGISPSEEESLFNFGDYVVGSTPMELAKNKNGILLGAGVAKKMSLEIGDKVNILSSSGNSIPLKIVGLYQSGLAEVDNILSYVNLSTAQKLLGKGRSYITDLNVKLFDMEKAPKMSKSLESNYDLSAVDIQTANAQFDTGSEIRNLITYAVSITLLIVAGFGIYNILNMLIYEKMNDIAILKAVGFTGVDVKHIFISQALIIGLVGGVLGLFVGYLGSLAIDYTSFETEALPTIKTYPINYDIMTYVIAVIFALVSTFLAGYLPSRKAENIDPVEIIRGQ